MKVLIVSRTFPAGHYRHPESTSFKRLILAGEKIHTIRANAKDYFKDGDKVSLRVWTGLPYRSKQREFAQMTIHLEPIDIVCASDMSLRCLVVGSEVAALDLCLHDGLTKDDFTDWFFPNGPGTFSGDILHFTDFRYGGSDVDCPYCEKGRDPNDGPYSRACTICKGTNVGGSK